ncbi:MAG TPA: hypothetical protein VJ301_13020 [Propionibacteriaceae bacterium]|nr:hypothetical protein [Propionibacteriaceae bacterium]
MAGYRKNRHERTSIPATSLREILRQHHDRKETDDPDGPWLPRRLRRRAWLVHPFADTQACQVAKEAKAPVG